MEHCSQVTRYNTTQVYSLGKLTGLSHAGENENIVCPWRRTGAHWDVSEEFSRAMMSGLCSDYRGVLEDHDSLELNAEDVRIILCKHDWSNSWWSYNFRAFSPYLYVLPLAGFLWICPVWTYYCPIQWRQGDSEVWGAGMRIQVSGSSLTSQWPAAWNHEQALQLISGHHLSPPTFQSQRAQESGNSSVPAPEQGTQYYETTDETITYAM